jgi:hypothetical protein
MSTVRAKFRCDSVTIKKGWSDKTPIVHSVQLNPVYANNDPNHENSKFWEATPSGSFSMDTIKPQNFEVGKEYYIDITPAL